MTALLGTTATRPDSTNGVFPTQAPDEPAMPYMVLSQVSGAPLQESMAGTGPLTTERWRFSCYGTTYKNAKKLAKALRQLMISVGGNYTVGKAFIEGSWVKLEADEAEPFGHGTLYSTHVDFEINYVDLDT